MSDIFLEVLNTSIAASWVVLAVVIARSLLRKAPRNLVCGLWALVGARLVIGRAWEAPFSLLPSAQTIPPESLFDRNPVIDSGVPIIDRVVNPVYTESFRANPAASVNPLQVWMAVWAMIWVLGMIVMLLWAFISWMRIRRQVRESIGESRGVYLCDRIDSPFILGIFRPRIYLPSDLDEDAKAHVIAHERAHLHRRDHWWKPLGYLLLTIYWFNPVLWLAYILLCRDIEMACDERVVRDMVVEEKKAYSAALLRCSISRRAIAACPLAFGEVGVKARIKSVLSYKKPAFWVILVTVVLIAALAAGFLTTPESGPAEIRYNGVLYVQMGEPVDHIPDKQQTADSLRSVLHDSTKHPEEDGQAVRLGWEYAGQPFVIVGNVLYLEQPGGGEWLPFLLKTPHEFLFDTLQKELDYLVSVKREHVQEWETLPDFQGDALLQALNSLRTTNFEPISESQVPKRILEVCFMQDSLTSAFNLYLSADEVWTLSFYDVEFGNNLWSFRNAELLEWAQFYLSRSDYYDSILSGEYNTVGYRTYENRGLALTVGLPDGWISEQTSKNSFDGIAFRFWPEDAEGFIHLQYEPEASWTPDDDRTCVDFTFPTGISAKCFERRDGKWDYMIFNTNYGCLLAARQLTGTWTEEQLQMAESILATVTAFFQGKNTMQDPNRLGIHLSVENVAPNGLTLVCTQDGTPWGDIITGAPWSLEQLTEEGWVSVMPESTAWTSIAYMVPQNEVTRWGINWSMIRGELPPGTYRVGKHFTATPVPPPWLNAAREKVEETVYAEFTIE